jgi:hypothetical protein
MTVCYGCLYDYTRKDNGPSELALVGRASTSSANRGNEAARADPHEDRFPAVEANETAASAATPAGTGPATTPMPAAKASASVPARSSTVSVAAADFDDEVTTVLDAPSAGEKAHAVWVKAAGVDVLVPLEDAGISVGRGSGNTVVLHDKSVSRRHLRITPAEGGAEVRDLGSTNPARFRGRPLRQSVLVGWGEEVELGGAVLAMCE